jgi:hypothetical protein
VKQIVKSAASIGASVVVALAVAMPVSARVGVTAAVVPQTDALRPGNPLEPLVLGADIDFNEHIVTAQDGRAQILFLDHSTLNVGPNADVVIDKFVYSPQDESGSLAISATKGVLRYIGGALSKHEDAVKIETPTAIIGIRGGIALVEVAASGATRATFLYGKEMTITGRDGLSLHLTRPGFTSSVGVGEQHPSTPAKADPVQIATTTAIAAPTNPTPTTTTTVTPAPAPAAASATAPTRTTSAPAPASTPASTKSLLIAATIAPPLAKTPIVKPIIAVVLPKPIGPGHTLPPKAVVVAPKKK